MVVPSILTRRLELVSLSPAFLLAVLGGRDEVDAALLDARLPREWDQRTLRNFAYRSDQLAAEPAQQPWLLRAMVERTPARCFAGYINFHDPPNETGIAEIGYTVLPDFRRRGYAEEAARAMISWAAQQGATTIRASIAPTNAPSLALAAKLGFVQTGSQWDDEDGEEIVFERPARLPPGPLPEREGGRRRSAVG